MIQLYDYFDSNSQDLYQSLKQSGLTSPVLVFNDDGFLPEGVTSPYTYFCDMANGQGKPLYFNQVPVPRYWEITGDNNRAEVWSYNDLKAKIFYASPKHLRLVKNVDWLDKKNRTRLTDHYNQFGWLFARTYFSEAEQITTKSYFNQQGQEVIVENALTGDVILNWQGKVHIFRDRLQFYRFFIDLMGWSHSHLCYNSLSTPFFYAYHTHQSGQDILFWQEDIGNEIPGNMRAMLERNNGRRSMIIVQKKASYDRLRQLLPEKDRDNCHYLGYLYPNYRQNLNRKTIFIFTNSDQVEHLEYLTEALFDYQFHIAALTEMSHRLMTFDQKENVQLYPNISTKTLERVYALCDLYFDINRADEVMTVVRRAFEQNMVIFGFDQTLHNPQLVLEEHIISLDRPDRLVELVRTYGEDLQPIAEKQRQTFDERPEEYRQRLGIGVSDDET